MRMLALFLALCFGTPALGQSLTLTSLKAPIAKAAGKPEAKSIAELWQQIAALPAYVAPPAAPVGPQPVTAWPKASLPEVLVPTGKGKAVVRLTFDAPLPTSLSLRYNTVNAVGAWEGGTYGKVAGTVNIPMGAREFTWDVPLWDMKDGWQIGFVVGWQEGTPQLAALSTRIKVGSPVSSTAAAVVPATPVPSANGKLFYETDFTDLSDFDKPTGLKSPTVENAYINEELGRYNQPGDDLALTLPMIGGVRNLQVTQLATPDKLGTRVLNVRQPMVTTRGRFEYTTGIFELTYGPVPVGAGVLPAWWALRVKPGWPPEADFLEVQEDGRPAVTSHFVGGKFGQKAFAAIDWSKPVTQRVEVTATTQRTWINGIFIDERPNVFREPMYHVFSIAVGGTAAGALPANTTLPIRMPLLRFRAWALP